MGLSQGHLGGQQQNQMNMQGSANDWGSSGQIDGQGQNQQHGNCWVWTIQWRVCTVTAAVVAGGQGQSLTHLTGGAGGAMDALLHRHRGTTTATTTTGNWYGWW
jgi:hypothetical protein